GRERGDRRASTHRQPARTPGALPARAYRFAPPGALAQRARADRLHQGLPRCPPRLALDPALDRAAARRDDRPQVLRNRLDAFTISDYDLRFADPNRKSQIVNLKSSVDRIQSKAARLRRIEHRLYNAPRGMRATELAEYCGVDRRTIYRDLTSLDEMGVPV